MSDKILSSRIFLFTLIIELITNFGNASLVLLLFTVVISLVLVNVKQNFKYLLILFLISDDQSRFLSDSLGHPIFSIYTLPNFSMIVTIFLLLVGVLKVIKNKNIFAFSEMKILFKFYAIIILFGLVFGILNIFKYPRMVIQDMSYQINSIAFLLVVFGVYYGNNKDLKKLLQSIVTAITVKYLILLTLFFNGDGEIVGQMVKVTGESGKSLVPLYSSIFLLLFIFVKNFTRYFYLLMFLVSLLITLSIASRSTMVFAILILISLIFIINISKSRKYLYFGYFFLGVSMTVVVIETIRPGAMVNVLWKLNSFGEININATSHSSLSPVIRYIELLNIFYAHIENYTIFFGSGFGSYFVDSYVKFPFNLFGIHAYKHEWIINRTFFKPHTTPIFLFLKIGLVGVLYYYGVFTKLFFLLKQKVKEIEVSLEYIFALAILPNIFLIITKNYSSKMQIALGIYIAIVFLITNSKKNEGKL